MSFQARKTSVHLWNTV